MTGQAHTENLCMTYISLHPERYFHVTYVLTYGFSIHIKHFYHVKSLDYFNLQFKPIRVDTNCIIVQITVITLRIKHIYT